MNTLMATLALLWVCLGAPPRSDGVIPVDSVLITLVEEVEVPARDAGPLVEMAVREGRLVKAGDVLGRTDDTEATFLRDRARVELAKARKLASSDVRVRIARKTQEIASAELKRATDALERFEKSVSQAEIDRLRLAAQRAAFETEQAELDYEAAQLAVQVSENELKRAEHNVQRRQIVAPISGVVVEVKRRRGEWLEPGQTVLRLVRMDRLRGEGFLSAKDAGGRLVGCRVSLTAPVAGGRIEEFSGELVFVSPEVDPVNGQVRVWAEIENRDSLLRPGLQATMIIAP